MFRYLSRAACLVLLGVVVAHAGDPKEKASADHHAAMKAEMMNCTVCRHMAAHLDELGPVMTMDVAMLNDGVAIMHGVSDPTKVETFHAVGAEMYKAGDTCTAMTDEQAKTSLCGFCQEIRAVLVSGGKMSHGSTKTGDVMVLTSADPAMQQRLHALGEKCVAMAQMM